MDRRVFSFLLLAFGISWGIVAMGYALGVRSATGPTYVMMAALCMLGPALAAVLQQRLLDKGPWSGLGLKVRGTGWRSFWITVLLGLAMMPAALGVQALFGTGLGLEPFGQVSVSRAQLQHALADLMAASGVPGSTGAMGRLGALPGGVVLLIIQAAALISALSVNIPFMLGEELGWRGYLWQRISAWRGLDRVLFTGTVWGLWHAPLIVLGHNYPDRPIVGIGMMVVLCLLFGLLFDWTRARTGTVWSSVVLHGLINGSAGIFALFAWGGHPLVASPVGVSGFVAFALLGAAVLTLDRTYRRTFIRRPEERPVQPAR